METTIEIIIEGRPVVFWNKLILYIDQQYHHGGDSEFSQKLYAVYNGPNNNRRMYYPKLLVPHEPEDIDTNTSQLLLNVYIPTIIQLEYTPGYDCFIRALLISETHTHVTFTYALGDPKRRPFLIDGWTQGLLEILQPISSKRSPDLMNTRLDKDNLIALGDGYRFVTIALDSMKTGAAELF